MVFLWVLAAERYVPAQAPLTPPLPGCSRRWPRPQRRPRRQGTRSPRCPGRPPATRASPNIEDAAVWDSTPTSTLCHLFPQGKHPWGDEFHGPHPANDTMPTQLATRRSVSQLPKPAHHSPGCTFLVPPPGSCSCLSQGRKTGLKVWLWHRPARPAARRDLPPRPTQPQLACQSWPRAREMQGHPSCACHPQP